MTARRLASNPIIHPGLSASLGSNINGPSLIRVPAWIEAPLGAYYLYFADHKGRYIRLAYADALAGPWTIHEPGTLHLRDTPFLQEPPPVPEGIDRAVVGKPRAEHVPSPLDDAITPHIASPDVHVIGEAQEIRLYYHGLDGFGRQVTRVARSRDGLRFESGHEILGRPYFRAFRLGEWTYAMAMPGVMYRSADGLTGFVEGPTLFAPEMRHAALLLDGDRLRVFWTRVGDAPERILLSEVRLEGDWMAWHVESTRELLRPELPFEGADLPAAPSLRSAALAPVNQLRDPAVYVEGERRYLLYSVAGEAGIAIAELLPAESGD